MFACVGQKIIEGRKPKGKRKLTVDKATQLTSYPGPGKREVSSSKRSISSGDSPNWITLDGWIWNRATTGKQSHKISRVQSFHKFPPVKNHPATTWDMMHLVGWIRGAAWSPWRAEFEWAVYSLPLEDEVGDVPSIGVVVEYKIQRLRYKEKEALGHKFWSQITTETGCVRFRPNQILIGRGKLIPTMWRRNKQ